MNTPNKISICRFFFAILMIIIYCLSFVIEAAPLGTTGFTWIDLVAAIIFILGGITDSIDGNIARKNNLITDLGKFLDPIADKFLVDSALILLSTKMDADGNFLLFPVITILFIGRDLIIDGLRMIAARKNITLAANKYGKAKTIMQMIIIPIIFLNGFPFNYFDLQGLGNFEYTYIITNFLGCLALVISLVSLIIYLIQNKNVLKEDKR